MLHAPVQIAVFVSGGGTNLQALIDAEREEKIPHGHIALVLSNNPDAYALQRAERAGIESVVVCRKDFEHGCDFEAALVAHLRRRGIGLIVLAGFMSILSAAFTAEYADRIINIHPSLIPSFCGKGYYGLHVHEAALACGVKVTGATVHYVNEIPDGGKIILQKAVRVLPHDTPESLQKRVMRLAEWKLLPEAAELVCRRLSVTERNDHE
ncbi:MAG: phosphoribosylglycinamide formyltransferase [Ndongobacter sp.]|nr:phosphoribosylglycinamide formyltransferase [Ndongobacter sp.]